MVKSSDLAMLHVTLILSKNIRFGIKFTNTVSCFFCIFYHQFSRKPHIGFSLLKPIKEFITRIALKDKLKYSTIPLHPL